MSRLFSFSEAETDCFNDNQDKIELVSCPRTKMICQKQLSFVNKCFKESEQYVRDKDFNRSIDTLKDAFYKTAELDQLPCAKCAALFRSTINESVESIHDELEGMISGLFGNKSYKSNLAKAANVLDEFEKVELHESFRANKSKRHFIGDYLNKQVS
jgi:hypothetical protein